MALEAGCARVLVIWNLPRIVIIVGIVAVVFVALDALEDRVVRLHNMAFGARIPRLPMLAAVDREEHVVIPVGGFPGAGRVAILTTDREARSQVIGVVRIVVIRLVAGQTISRRAGVAGVVTGQTIQRPVGSGERESRRIISSEGSLLATFRLQC